MAERDVDYCFSSYGEADAFISQYENEAGYRYIRLKSKMEQRTGVQSLEGHRLLFTDRSRKGPCCTQDCLFIILQSELRECMHGSKHGKCKRKRTSARTIAQDTKKMGCPAKVIIKTVLQFPDYESADFNQMLDVAVKTYIKTKVKEGIKNVDDMISRLNDLPCVRENRPTNRRFHPSRKTVYNIMYNELNSERHTKNDQINTKLFLEKKENDTEDRFFFRPTSDPDTEPKEAQSLLFVYESKFQHRILTKYAGEVAMLDATYNTCKFNVPLYQLAVQTSCGFVVVASFIIGRDTKSQMAEALGVIKTWNPTWCPKYFLTDYDVREISSLESVFKGSKVFLCQFHVIQAWKRWIGSNKELNTKEKKYILEKLKHICNSESEEEYHDRVRSLKETDVYKQNRKLSGWLETKWFPEEKRWVDYQREDMPIRNDTTNGLEVQHRIFKDNFLRKHGFSNTLLSVVEVLIDRYCPAMEVRYKEENVKAMDTSKLYADNVPAFLVNKPKLFVGHCLQRMPPNVSAVDKADVALRDNDSFNLRSPDSGEMYSVTFTKMYPHCNCKDFKRKHWPCKHLLCIMHMFPQYDWDHLSAEYTGQNCFCVDLDAMCAEKDKETSENIEHNYYATNSEQCKEEQEPSCLIERKKCLSVTQEITNNIYCVDEVEVLEQAHGKLRDLNDFLWKNIPTVGDLPIRKRGRKRNVIRHANKKKTEAKIHEDIETEIICDFPLYDSEVDEDTNNEEHIDEEERVLREIWRTDGSEEVIVEIGPYKLTRNSFKFLKDRLSDEVIDAYLSLILKGTNVHHINCVAATAIFTGMVYGHGYLRTTMLSQYEKIVCAVNEGGHHWVLVIIEPEKRKILYLNPLGELPRTCEKMLHYWYDFLKGRKDKYMLEELNGEWYLEQLKHTKQNDGRSCGVYVLTFAEKYLNGDSLTFNWNTEDVIAERVKVGKRLIAYASSILPDVSTGIEEVTCESNFTASKSENVKYVSEDVSSSDRVKSREIKKKRKTSFVYFTPRRGQRKHKKSKGKTYCVCKKPDDGRVYWQCDTCEEWHHPGCVGLIENEEPEIYICNNCQIKETCPPSSDDEATAKPSNVGINMQSSAADGKCESSKFGELDESSDVEITGESEFGAQWFNKYDEVMNLLTETMSCDNRECDDVQHSRHHNFCRQPAHFVTQSNRLHLFGRDYFSEQNEHCLYLKLMNDLHIQKVDPRFPVTGLRISTIKGVENNVLGGIFNDLKFRKRRYNEEGQK